MGTDALTVGLWFAVGLLGVLVGTLQRRGRDYYPANLLLGLACGVNSVFYLALLGGFRGDVDALRRWSLDTRAGLWVNVATLVVLLWALYLIIRANRQAAGGALDMTGQTGPPTAEQVTEAFAVLDRYQGLTARQRGRIARFLAAQGRVLDALHEGEE